MILRRIMLPLVRNGVIVVLITNFIAAWGEWLLANTLTNDQEKRTLTVVLASATRVRSVAVADDGGDVRDRDPPGLIAFIVQRWYMRGLQERSKG